MDAESPTARDRRALHTILLTLGATAAIALGAIAVAARSPMTTPRARRSTRSGSSW